MYVKYLKRFFDLVFCIFAMLVFCVLMIIIGLLIKLDDNGPIFYVSNRIGKNSKIFKMIKFRSMKINAPLILNPDGSTYNSINDPRVTRVGKFLRRTSMDETPQIINVLKGDMSIIGPRASLSSALETFLEDELDKMKVKPGITGFVQAYYRNSISSREKRLKDAWYANNVSFSLDLKIMIRSIFTILQGSNLFTN